MRSDSAVELILKAIAPSRPVKGERGEDRRHGMIGVAGDASARVKSEQDLRPKFPYAQHEIRNHPLHFQPMQLAVGIVQHNSARDFKNFAGVGKFLTAYCGQLLIVARGATVSCGLAGGQANDAGFYPALSIEAQRSAEAAGFVIRMGGHDHHA